MNVFNVKKLKEKKRKKISKKKKKKNLMTNNLIVDNRLLIWRLEVRIFLEKTVTILFFFL